MYGMYVHMEAVTYVTFPNKQDFLPKLIKQKYKRNCQTRIYSCCMPLYCLWCTTLPIKYGIGPWLLKNAERKRPREKRITKTQELWTNKWCHNALCIKIVMVYGITNLYYYMHFFRYSDVFTIQSGVSFPLLVLTHVTWIVYKHPFSNQWLYFLVTLYRIC